MLRGRIHLTLGPRGRRWLGATLLLASLGSGMPAPVLVHAQEAPHRSARSRIAAFRSRVAGEMERAFGKPVKNRQDAINAAYLSVGWTWGAATTDALDNAAYRQAWAWGFRIEEFSARRYERFSLDALAEGPIDPDKQPVLAERAPPARMPARTKGEPATPAVASVAPAAALDPSELDQVQKRIAEAREELSRIQQEIAELETSSRGASNLSKERAAELREAVDTLERLLEQQGRSLDAINGDVNAIGRELDQR